MDEAARELALVVQALQSGLSNCVRWVNARAEERVRNDPANRGLTPEGIRKLVLDNVAQGRQVDQRLETREEYQDRRTYWYRVLIPVPGFPRGLFVEME